MSTDDQNPSGKKGEGASGEDTDQVAYSTYKKVLSEAKNTKARLAELEAEIEAQKQAKLQEEGKFKELADANEKRAKEAEEKALKTAKTYGQKIFTSDVKAMAKELGANPDALEDIVRIGDWSKVEFDAENHETNRDQLKAALLEMQKSKPYLFGKKVVAPKDVSPGKGGVEKTHDFSKMSVEELVAFGRQNKDSIK